MTLMYAFQKVMEREARLKCIKGDWEVRKYQRIFYENYQRIGIYMKFAIINTCIYEYKLEVVSSIVCFSLTMSITWRR